MLQHSVILAHQNPRRSGLVRKHFTVSGIVVVEDRKESLLRLDSSVAQKPDAEKNGLSIASLSAGHVVSLFPNNPESLLQFCLLQMATPLQQLLPLPFKSSLLLALVGSRNDHPIFEGQLPLLISDH